MKKYQIILADPPWNFKYQGKSNPNDMAVYRACEHYDTMDIDEIKKLPIATPSMQWWERQPESARQGWLGFAEYSGATPMDVLSEMQRQLTQPKQPRQRSIARQRTWV